MRKINDGATLSWLCLLALAGCVFVRAVAKTEPAVPSGGDQRQLEELSGRVASAMDEADLANARVWAVYLRLRDVEKKLGMKVDPGLKLEYFSAEPAPD